MTYEMKTQEDCELAESKMSADLLSKALFQPVKREQHTLYTEQSQWLWGTLLVPAGGIKCVRFGPACPHSCQSKPAAQLITEIVGCITPWSAQSALPTK